MHYRDGSEIKKIDLLLVWLYFIFLLIQKEQISLFYWSRIRLIVIDVFWQKILIVDPPSLYFLLNYWGSLFLSIYYIRKALTICCFIYWVISPFAGCWIEILFIITILSKQLFWVFFQTFINIWESFLIKLAHHMLLLDKIFYLLFLIWNCHCVILL